MKTSIFLIDQKKTFAHGWVNIPKEVIENCIGLSNNPCSTLEAMLTILLHVNYSDRNYKVGTRKVQCHRGESVRTFTDWAKMFGWSRTKTKRYFKWLESINYIRFIEDPYCLSHFVVLTYEEFVLGPNCNNMSLRYSTASENGKDKKANSNIDFQTRKKKTDNNSESKGVSYKNKICESEDCSCESRNGKSCKNGSYEEKDCTNESCKNGSCTNEISGNTICESENKKREMGKNHSNSLLECHAQFLKFWDAYYEVVQLPRKNIGKAEKEWNRLSEEEKELAMENISNYYYSLTDTRFMLQPANYLANKAFLDDFEMNNNQN